MRGLLWSILALLSLAGLPGTAFSGPMTLYSIDSKKALLYTIDPTNGSTISTVTLSLPGHTVFHGNGLAANPVTKELYALLELGFQDRELVKLDPVTGIGTLVGPTAGYGWAGITFASDGTLYAVTGDNTAQGPGETLFTLDINTGTPTLVVALGNGSGGEIIAYNPDDDLIYHSSGKTGGGSSFAFETVNRASPFAITNIPTSGDPNRELTALLYAGGGVFLAADNHEEPNGTLTPKFYSITDDGVVDLLGDISHISKGLAFVESADAPEPGSLALLGLGLAAGALGRRRKRITTA